MDPIPTPQHSYSTPDGSVPRPSLWRRWIDRVSRLGRALAWTWRQLSRVLRVGLALLAVVAVAGAYRANQAPPLLDKTVLVLDLQGPLREQASGDTRSNLLSQVEGKDRREVLLREVLEALEIARTDARIASVLLKLDGFGGGGLSSLREVAAAVTRVREAGKPVRAWGTDWDQRAFYLAAHADTVWLDPMGSVLVEGLGRRRLYYRDALDKLGIEANVLRVGKFKNAGEPYFANGPSPESLESEATLLEALWGLYTSGVEKARGLPTGAIASAIDGLPASLAESQGDAAQWAVRQRWVDGLKTRQELRAALIEAGAPDAEGKTFRQIGYRALLRHRTPVPAGSGVAVVVAEGEITDGEAPSGRIGGDSTAALIRQAREDEGVKAVVLRVNSPGGSAFASELIRRELALTREAGKPVVVSMGDVAASGGYWVSMAADEVIADPATVTGSIGVFAMLPTGPGLLNTLGLRTGGHRTTWLAGGYDPRVGLDPRLAEMVQLSIGRIYADFTRMAAEARKKPVDSIDAVAQGRVWTGAQALDHGLIDRVGSWSDALQSARQRAGLPADAPVRYVEKPVGRWVRLLQSLGLETSVAWTDPFRAMLSAILGNALRDAVAQEAPALSWMAGLSGMLPDEMQALAAEGQWLSDVMRGRKPYAAVVHCLCVAQP